MAGKKEGKKHRKHGRNKKRCSTERQMTRTAHNKMRTINWERKKAGLPPVDIYTAVNLCKQHRIAA